MKRDGNDMMGMGIGISLFQSTGQDCSLDELCLASSAREGQVLATSGSCSVEPQGAGPTPRYDIVFSAKRSRNTAS